MDKATDWIHDNMELIDLVGKTELAKIAFEHGFVQGEISGLKEAKGLVKIMMDKQE